MSGSFDYDALDAVGMAEFVRNKQASAAELVDEAIARIERLNPVLNAVVIEAFEEARARAKETPGEGPFAGVPFLLKNLGTPAKGMRLTNGSRFFRDFVADADATLTHRYRDAGLIFLGRTNSPEFGLAPFTEPELHGPTNNSWDLTRTPGGSSGGAAAAVAAGLVPMAHASDGGGSIRIPASCCGLFGLKPTRARIPMGPQQVEGWVGASISHVISRSVRDSAALLDATHGPEPGAPYEVRPPEGPWLDEVGRDPGKLRIAFTTEPLLHTELDPRCTEGVRRTARLLEELGHELIEAKPPVDCARFVANFLLVVAAEARSEIQVAGELLGRKPTHSQFEDETWLLALLGEQYSAAEFSGALRYLRRVGVDIAYFMKDGGYDVLLSSTLGKPPVPTGTVRNDGVERVIQSLLASASAGRVAKWLGGLESQIDTIFSFIPYTGVYNVTGQPSASIPLEWTEDGLPMGMMFTGRFGDEATLFRLAGQLEQARPWWDKRPPNRA